MSDLTFWIGYGLIGCIITGMVSTVVLKEAPDSEVIIPVVLLGPILYPLVIPYLFILLINRITHFFLYAKKERVEKVTNKLKGTYEI